MSFWEWICFKRNLNFADAPWLGPIIGGVIFLILLAVVIGGGATLFHFLFEVLRIDADYEAIRNIGLIVVAVLGAPFVVWRAIVAQKQADTAEQSLITDQINNAVDGLGAEKTVSKIGRSVRLGGEPGRTEIEWQNSPLAVSDDEEITSIGDWSVYAESLPNFEVRLGAIYALERIAKDSPRDHTQVMEILTAYIRQNAPVINLEASETPFDRARPRVDIQAALDVIGRRSQQSIQIEHEQKFRLDLRYTDLSGATFSKGNFVGANLTGSRLEGSIFRSSDLRAIRLYGCLLNFADFFEANLEGAILDQAIISAHNAFVTPFSNALNTRGLSMAGADFSGIDHISIEDKHRPTFATQDTQFGGNLLLKIRERRGDMDQFNYALHGLEIEDEKGVRKRLEKAGFLYWSPFTIDDLANGSIRRALYDFLGLKGFPYDDR